jgi:hypothetical protein
MRGIHSNTTATTITTVLITAAGTPLVASVAVEKLKAVCHSATIKIE